MLFAPRTSRLRSAIRVHIFLAGLLAVASNAFAEPRLVRVIWDVGQQAVFYRIYERAQAGQDAFVVPPDAAAATSQGFSRLGVEDVLRKDDSVRIYVVNYNPVSHVWHESSAVDQVVLQPSLVGPLLNALALGISGTSGLPAIDLNAIVAMDAPGLANGCTELSGVRTAVGTLRIEALRVHDAADSMLHQAETLHFPAAARQLAKIPANAVLWREFDNLKAWELIRNNQQVLGADFDTAYKPLEAAIEQFGKHVDAANAALLALDRQLATLGSLSSSCSAEGKALVVQRENIVALLKEVSGADSGAREMAASFEAASSLWSAYERQLAHADWTGDAIELVVKDPIQGDSVLRVDAVFGSPEQTIKDHTQRSLVLGVRAHLPRLVISTGVGFNTFGFKALQAVQATASADEGGVEVRNRIDIVDDTSWQPVVPVWVQSLKVKEWKDAGLYGTFGTTPDRNIFKNGIVGASVFVPRWRTMFTVGLIAARGHEAEDLDPLVKEFSDPAGFALADVSAGDLPLPQAGWKKSPYASVTFMLFSY